MYRIDVFIVIVCVCNYCGLFRIQAASACSKMDKVYLDYNATTPLAPEVLDVITTVLRDAWGNPSSGHHAGSMPVPTLTYHVA